MDVNKIQGITNLGISDKQKEMAILSVIAEDKNAIPIILRILNNEREKKRGIDFG